VAFPPGDRTAATDAAAERPVYMPELGGYAAVPVIRRSALGAEAVIDGPLIVQDVESTVVVLPGDRVRVDRHRHLLIEVGA
jgi:N-methylhydantoinase A